MRHKSCASPDGRSLKISAAECKVVAVPICTTKHLPRLLQNSDCLAVLPNLRADAGPISGTTKDIHVARSPHALLQRSQLSRHLWWLKISQVRPARRFSLIARLVKSHLRRAIGSCEGLVPPPPFAQVDFLLRLILDKCFQNLRPTKPKLLSKLV